MGRPIFVILKNFERSNFSFRTLSIRKYISPIAVVDRPKKVTNRASKAIVNVTKARVTSALILMIGLF